jgi:ligand-binding sensor domain-containing protein/signal transduction histidine kinase
MALPEHRRKRARCKRASTTFCSGWLGLGFWRRAAGAAVLALLALLAGSASGKITVEAWYHLNDNTLPQDASGHGRHFRNPMPGSTHPSADSAGGPLGPSNYVSTASLEFGREDIGGFWDNGYAAPDDNVGIEVWVRPFGAGCLTSPKNLNGWILSTGGEEIGGLDLAVQRQGRSSTFLAGLVCKGYVGRPFPADPARWTHLAVVRDRGVTTFYVNGVPCGDPSSETPNPATVVHLGVTAGGAAGFKGLIDEARIFTFAPGEFSPSDLLLRSLNRAAGQAAQFENAPAAHYRVETWQSDSGLPQNTVTAITQTPDGYLWVGTLGGLARFDGAQFKVFNGANAPALGNGRIRSLSVGRAGALWVTTAEGALARFAGGQFTVEQPPVPNGARPVFLEAMEDDAGAVWLATAAGEVARWSGGRYSVLLSNANVADLELHGARTKPGAPLVWSSGKLYQAGEDGLALELEAPSAPARFFVGPGRAGGYWFNNGQKLRLWKAGKWVAAASSPANVVPALRDCIEDREGRMWLATADSGLMRWDTKLGSKEFSTRDGLGSDTVRCLFEDAEGNIWAGTEGGGLSRLSPALFSVFGRAEGLSADRMTCVCEGADGTIWAGTEGEGLNQFRPGSAPLLFRGPSNSLADVSSLVCDRQGRIWAGSPSGGLWRQTEGAFQRPPGWPEPERPVQSLFQDASGRIWVGRSRTRALVVMENETNKVVPLPLKVDTSILAMEQDSEGALWVGTDGEGLLCLRGNEWARFTRAEGLGSDIIWCLRAEKSGALWVGTYGGGLSRLKAGKIATCTTREGLEDDVIIHIAEDGRGNFWLGSHQGVFRVGKAELNDFAEGKRARIQCIGYGKEDGLGSLECAGPSPSAGCRSSDGRLWFPTLKGVVMVDPFTVKKSLLPPPVLVDKLLVDEEEKKLPSDGRLLSSTNAAAPGFGADNELVFSTGNRRYRFHYTGMSFTAPERLRFRTRLEGLEPEWVEVGRERTAAYSQLKAGRYVFRVQARSRDGVWSDPGAAVAFVVQPRFYESGWFQGAAMGALALGLGFVVRTASNRRLRRQLERVEMQTAVERERARIAQDIHDDLGSSLNEIAMLSELAQTRLDRPQQARVHMDDIFGTASRLARSVDEIVWAVSPKNDALEVSLAYICKGAEDFLHMAGITCRLEMPETLPSRGLSSAVRHHLYLAVRAALNNVVQHAAATEVRLLVSAESGWLALEIADNGRGFDASTAAIAAAGELRGRRPQGLDGMAERLREAGGRCEIESEPGRGTVIRLVAPFKAEENE